MKHPEEQELILYYYGEGEDRHVIASHLESCEACRTNYRALDRVLNAVDTLPMPDRAASYGAEVWRRVRPQLEDRGVGDPSWWSGLLDSFRLPRWALAGAVALLVLAAFLAGRFGGGPPELPGLALSPRSLSLQSRERGLLNEIGGHLERSQLTLIELINARTNGAVDISIEQALAGELAAINRLFRRAALDGGEPGMASVLEELERVLVEVANGPANLSAESFADLRQRIGSDGLLFRIKVVAAQLRAKERDAAREGLVNRS